VRCASVIVALIDSVEAAGLIDSVEGAGLIDSVEVVSSDVSTDMP
jgi:hypothetical protein